MITNNIDTFTCQQQFFSGERNSPAFCLGPTERKNLSIQVLARTEPITHLAARLGIRTLGVFGPINPAVYRPIGPAVTVFVDSTAAFAKKPSARLQKKLLKVLLADIS